MEKYARQALSEGVTSADEIHVSVESEIYRVLNLHYNRNNHIEVSQSYQLLFRSPPLSLFLALFLSLSVFLSFSSTAVCASGSVGLRRVLGARPRHSKVHFIRPNMKALSRCSLNLLPLSIFHLALIPQMRLHPRLSSAPRSTYVQPLRDSAGCADQSGCCSPMCVNEGAMGRDRTCKAKIAIFFPLLNS